MEPPNFLLETCPENATEKLDWNCSMNSLLVSKIPGNFFIDMLPYVAPYRPTYSINHSWNSDVTSADAELNPCGVRMSYRAFV
jgi:hypothetical protein